VRKEKTEREKDKEERTPAVTNEESWGLYVIGGHEICRRCSRGVESQCLVKKHIGNGVNRGEAERVKHSMCSHAQVAGSERRGGKIKTKDEIFT